MLPEKWLLWAFVSASVSCAFCNSSMSMEHSKGCLPHGMNGIAHFILPWPQSLLLCWALQRVAQWFGALNVASAQSSSDRFLEDPASLQKVLRLQDRCVTLDASHFGCCNDARTS